MMGRWLSWGPRDVERRVFRAEISVPSEESSSAGQAAEEAKSSSKYRDRIRHVERHRSQISSSSWPVVRRTVWSLNSLQMRSNLTKTKCVTTSVPSGRCSRRTITHDNGFCCVGSRSARAQVPTVAVVTVRKEGSQHDPMLMEWSEKQRHQSCDSTVGCLNRCTTDVQNCRTSHDTPSVRVVHESRMRVRCSCLTGKSTQRQRWHALTECAFYFISKGVILQGLRHESPSNWYLERQFRSRSPNPARRRERTGGRIDVCSVLLDTAPSASDSVSRTSRIRAPVDVFWWRVRRDNSWDWWSASRALERKLNVHTSVTVDVSKTKFGIRSESNPPHAMCLWKVADFTATERRDSETTEDKQMHQSVEDTCAKARDRSQKGSGESNRTCLNELRWLRTSNHRD